MTGSLPQVILKRGRERPLQEGHPWVFTGAVATHAEGAEPGCIVAVCDSDGRFVAKGYYNPASSIPVRVLTREIEEPIDAGFFEKRIRRALDLRALHFDPAITNAFRVVHGESDALPGLIVDRYAGYLVVQLHTMGMDRLRETVLDALEAALDPRGIFERSDVGTRKAEGFAETVAPVGGVRGEAPPERIEILENRLRFLVDVRGGQKTGFFLDQRDNRLGLQGLTRGRDVLNCFSYTGGFSVYAAAGGASRVVSVDSSEPAIAMSAANLEANGFDPGRHPGVVANVFDYLKDARAQGERFDVVVVDPPAFVTSREGVERAAKSYISLNRRAIEITRPGGILVTASCSTQIDYERFLSIVRHAATAARKEVQIFRIHLTSVDHPVSTRVLEGRYLKCVFGMVRGM